MSACRCQWKKCGFFVFIISVRMQQVLMVGMTTTAYRAIQTSEYSVTKVWNLSTAPTFAQSTDTLSEKISTKRHESTTNKKTVEESTRPSTLASQFLNGVETHTTKSPSAQTTTHNSTGIRSTQSTKQKTTGIPSTQTTTQKSTKTPLTQTTTQKTTGTPFKRTTKQKSTGTPSTHTITQKSTNTPSTQTTTQKSTETPSTRTTTQKTTGTPSTRTTTQKTTGTPSTHTTTQKSTNTPSTQTTTQKTTGTPSTRTTTQKTTGTPSTHTTTQKSTNTPSTQTTTQKSTGTPSTRTTTQKTTGTPSTHTTTQKSTNTPSTQTTTQKTTGTLSTPTTTQKTTGTPSTQRPITTTRNLLTHSTKKDGRSARPTSLDQRVSSPSKDNKSNETLGTNLSSLPGNIQQSSIAETSVDSPVYSTKVDILTMTPRQEAKTRITTSTVERANSPGADGLNAANTSTVACSPTTSDPVERKFDGNGNQGIDVGTAVAILVVAVFASVVMTAVIVCCWFQYKLKYVCNLRAKETAVNRGRHNIVTDFLSSHVYAEIPMNSAAGETSIRQNINNVQNRGCSPQINRPNRRDADQSNHPAIPSISFAAPSPPAANKSEQGHQSEHQLRPDTRCSRSSGKSSDGMNISKDSESDFGIYIDQL